MQASRLYQIEKKYDLALDQLRILIDQNKEDNEDLLLQKQELFIKNNQIDSAIVLSEQLVAQHKEEPRYYLLLSELYGVNKKTSEKNKIDELSKTLQAELNNSNKLREAIEIEKNIAVNDLDATIKKSQNELIKTIVKSALFVIMSVGFITTIMYSFAILSDKDTQIIGSTWSNMFSVLLTNAFSIVGTIMGIKYATQDSDKTKTTK